MCPIVAEQSLDWSRVNDAPRCVCGGDTATVKWRHADFRILVWFTWQKLSSHDEFTKQSVTPVDENDLELLVTVLCQIVMDTILNLQACYLLYANKRTFYFMQ